MSAIFWCITVLVWATSLTVPYGRGDYAACKCLETTAKEAGSEGNSTGLTTCATPSNAGTLLGQDLGSIDGVIGAFTTTPWATRNAKWCMPDRALRDDGLEGSRTVTSATKGASKGALCTNVGENGIISEPLSTAEQITR